MGKKTSAALKECGAVYLNAIGGAAQFYARCMPKVDGVHLMEFGIPKPCGRFKWRDSRHRHHGCAWRQPARGNRTSNGRGVGQTCGSIEGLMANKTNAVWSAKAIGSGTFQISKPKRKSKKQHAARVRNKRRAR